MKSNIYYLRQKYGICRYRPILFTLYSLLGWPHFAYAAKADAANVQTVLAKHHHLSFQAWLTSANGGDPYAQFELGKLYEQGLGVPEDYVEAYRWYNLAAATGLSEAAKARDDLAAKMTPQDIAEAQKLSTEWRPASVAPKPAPSQAAPLTTAKAAPSSAATEKDAITQFKKGLAALRAGKADEAIADLRAGLKVKPDPVAEFLLGEAYQQKHEGQLAQQAFQRSLNLDPKSPVTAQARQALAQTSGTPMATAGGSASGATSPNETAAGTSTAPALPAVAAQDFRTGLKALQAGKPDDAIAAFSAGLKIHQDATAEFFLGQAYQQKHEDDLAAKAYQASLTADPNSKVAGQARKAEAALTALLTLSSKQVADVQRMLDVVGFDAGPADGNAGPKTAAAIKAFQKAQSLPTNGQITPVALSLLQREADARTKQADVRFRAGFEAAKAKNWSATIRDFRAGLVIAPDARAEFYLGEAYRVTGNKDAALAAYRASVRIDPHSSVADMAVTDASEMESAAGGESHSSEISGGLGQPAETSTGPNGTHEQFSIVTRKQADNLADRILSASISSSDPVNRELAGRWEEAAASKLFGFQEAFMKDGCRFLSSGGVVDVYSIRMFSMFSRANGYFEFYTFVDVPGGWGAHPPSPGVRISVLKTRILATGQNWLEVFDGIKMRKLDRVMLPEKADYKNLGPTWSIADRPLGGKAFYFVRCLN